MASPCRWGILHDRTVNHPHTGGARIPTTGNQLILRPQH
nr:MAG TPA: hypothetical protein [Caudoviricetes sp.]